MARIIQKSSYGKDEYGNIMRHSTVVECCWKPLECPGTCPYCGKQYDIEGKEIRREGE
jgi:hypothetical protein